MQKRNHQFLIFFAVVLYGFFLLPSITHAGIIPQPPNNLGLVGYWSFEGTQDTSVDDYSGNGNTGTMTNMDTGTDYVSGYKNGSTALDFDGVDDSVQTPSYTYTTNSPFTVSLWFRPTQNSNTYGAGYPSLFDRATDGNTGLWFGAGASGSYVNTLAIYTEGTGQYIYANTTHTLNQWHHAVLVYDGATLTMYQDNSIVASATATFPGKTRPFAIGGGGGWSADFFRGKIDEVRIYSRALSTSEISLLYNSKKTTYQPVDKTNLVGYWSFEDATGTTATDFSGSGNHGTLTNMTNDDWVNGRVGKALDFDGSDDYVKVNTDPLGTNYTNFSISTWFKTSASPGTNQLLVGRINQTDDNSILNGVVRTDRVLGFDFYNPSGGALAGATIVNDGVWHHAVFVSSGTNRYIYLDGQLDASESSAEVYSGLSPNTITMGADVRNTVNGSKLNGQLDEVRIYSTALTATQITDLYQSSKYTQINTPQNNKLTDGLVGYWTFNGADVDATTIKDVSGNANNGIATNGPVPAIGKVGQGMNFDGTNDYVDVGNVSVLDIDNTDSVTYSYWIKTTQSSDAAIVGKTTAGAGNSLQQTGLGWSSGSFYIQMSDTSANYIARYTNGPINDGVWHHVVATYDGSQSTLGLVLYVDGQSIATTAASSGTLGSTSNSSSFKIGDRTNFNIPYQGLVDEVRVYNRVLTAVEIKRLYNLGR